MKRVFIGIAIAVTLSGCASASKTYGPDGREAYALNCSGLARTWAACLERAGDICGEKGYNVVSANGESGGFIAAGGPNNFAAGSGISRSMVVSCKG